MVYFPYDSFMVSAPASQAEVVVALQSVVKPKGLSLFGSFSDGPLSYEGKVADEGFRMVRIPSRSDKHAYCQVRGTFATDDDKTRIRVTVSISPTVWASIMLMTTLLGLLSFFFIKTGARDVAFLLGTVEIPGLLIVNYGLSVHSVIQELDNVQTFLYEVVDNLKVTGNQQLGEKVECLK